MKKQIKSALPTTTGTNLVAPSVTDDAGFANYLRTIAQFPILSAEEEYDYASRWAKNQDNDAAEKLLVSHLRLVVSVAYDFRNYGIPVQELVASGNMGLMQALQKFDPEKVFGFPHMLCFGFARKFMKRF